jgi:lipoprotein-releasing system ATP-binding protein
MSTVSSNLDAIIIAHNIKKSYGDLTILDIQEIMISKGKVTSIVGPSGAGKSTLLHILGTLLKPDQGEIFIDQKNVYSLKESELASFRNLHLGFIFQFHHLLPEFNALENVCLPAMIAHKERSFYEPKAKDLLSFLGLKNRILHKPNELSGGEQQRVAIARALINDPKMIFADEPTGNLDTKNATDLHNLFLQINQEFGHTFLIVTHNKQMAEMSHQIIEMRDGSLI